MHHLLSQLLIYLHNNPVKYVLLAQFYGLTIEASSLEIDFSYSKSRALSALPPKRNREKSPTNGDVDVEEWFALGAWVFLLSHYYSNLLC